MILHASEDTTLGSHLEVKSFKKLSVLDRNTWYHYYCKDSAMALFLLIICLDYLLQTSTDLSL